MDHVAAPFGAHGLHQLASGATEPADGLLFAIVVKVARTQVEDVHQTFAEWVCECVGLEAVNVGQVIGGSGFAGACAAGKPDQ
ncbi:hypothetical protein D3C85_961780 [compost metagenome]